MPVALTCIANIVEPRGDSLCEYCIRNVRVLVVEAQRVYDKCWRSACQSRQATLSGVNLTPR